MVNGSDSFDFVQAASTLLAAAIGSLFTLITYRGGKSSETARERLNNVYAPAFELIEDSLYENIPIEKCVELLKALESIASKGGVLSDPALKDLISSCKLCVHDKAFDFKNFKYKFFDLRPSYLTYWYKICSHIDKTYDSLCKKTFLPVRSISYRLKRGQYINTLIWTLNFLKSEWPNLVFWVILIALTLLQKLPIT